MDLISRAGLFFFMTFSLHLSVDSCADIDDYFRGSSTSWLGGSLLVGGQRTGLCVWVCLQGRLEAIQKWNGARFRCLQPKHFQSRINNTTFQLFTMNNNQLSVFKEFSKKNHKCRKGIKTVLQMLSLHGKSFCKMLFSNSFFYLSYVSSGSQGSGGLREGLMLLRVNWRCVKSWRAIFAWGTLDWSNLPNPLWS